MTGYLVSLNGGAISWRSSRQGGVTLSSREAEFVAASWTEVAYLCVLLRGFGYTQKKPRDRWEDNASYVMMSENPTNRDRSRRVDVKVHYLRDLVRVKLVKCAGTQNVSDALTKSLAQPACFGETQGIYVGYTCALFGSACDQAGVNKRISEKRKRGSRPQGLFSFLPKEVLSKSYGELACVQELSKRGNGCAAERVCSLAGVQPCLERVPPCLSDGN